MSQVSWCWMLLVLAPGCDRVFGLTELSPPVDAATSDANLDANLDNCPSGYAPIVGGATRYRFVTELQNWEFAHDDCANDTSVAITHLVEFDDQAELDAVRAAFPVLAPWEAWVGYARDLAGDPHVFHGTTGVLLPLGSPVWAGGEPDNSAGDEVVTFFGNNFDVVDGPRPTPYRYVCECDGVAGDRVFTF
ncbi:MAG: C-type lectin domain-containing protein [Proteobacteria bacterium]|nr:C-type lectin domain-containing protein [Pseudomonadota bacterium]